MEPAPCTDRCVGRGQEAEAGHPGRGLPALILFPELGVDRTGSLLGLKASVRKEIYLKTPGWFFTVWNKSKKP